MSCQVPLACSKNSATFPSKRRLRKSRKGPHYKCSICQESFLDQGLLEAHVSEWHTPAPCPKCSFKASCKVDWRIKCLKCKFCPYYFEDSSVLKEHVIKCHPPTPCEPCSITFYREVDLNNHLKSEHCFKCSFCRRIIQDRSCLQAHVSNYHAPISCPMCFGIFSSEEQLVLHKKETDLFLGCHLCCQKFFVDESALKRHIEETHTPVDCSTCSVTFSGKEDLLTHNRVKHRLECWFCQETFVGKVGVPGHITQSHPRAECPTCSISFSLKMDLENHLCVENPLRCTVCLKSFGGLVNLMAHISESHSPVSCPICSITFSCKKGLEDHRGSGHRLKCCFCPKMLLDQDVLQAHISEHHTPAVCPICSVKFPYKKRLIDHQEKVAHYLKCKFCRLKSFFGVSDLSRHIRESHSPASCPICSIKFRCKKDMENHRGVKHRLKCISCSRTFMSQGDLHSHTFESHLSVACPVCARIFRCRHDLVNHKMASHRLKCSFCLGTFPGEESLHTHILRLHLAFTCTICTLTFPSQEDSIEHRKTTHPLSCSLSRAKFVDVGSLLAHVHTVTFRKKKRRKKLYNLLIACDVCNGCFPDIRALARHITKCHTSSDFQTCYD